MRVALLLQQLAPDLEGGSERSALASARALRARGHEVWIVCGSRRPADGAEVLEETREGLRVARLTRREGERWERARTWPRLARLAARMCAGADVVHVHHLSTFGAGAVRALAARAPVVATLHDGFAACPRGDRRSPVPGLACPEAGDLEPCVACLSDVGPADAVRAALGERARLLAADLAAASALLAPSAFHARALRRALGPSAAALAVLPPMPPRTLPRVRAPEELAPGPGAPLRVLHPGNPARAKGTLDLVHALAPLAPRLELDILGPAVEPGLWEAVEAVRGALRVRWLGAYQTPELTDAARRAHVAALPSRLEESYGLAADEAVALGLPAWVSDRGAPAERIAAAGTGRVLPAEDPAAWTAAFAQALADPAALVREGQRIAAGSGAAEAHVDALEALYRDCGARDRAARAC